MPDISLGAVPRGSRELRAYVARPAGPGPWPGVVAIHEAFGVDEVLRRQCDRLAAAGYLTIAPDLFSDGGAAALPGRHVPRDVSGRGKAYADIEAARRHLLDDGGLHRQGRRHRVLHGRRVRADDGQPRLRRRRRQLRCGAAAPGRGVRRRLPGRGELRRARSADGRPAEEGQAGARRARRRARFQGLSGRRPLVPQRRGDGPEAATPVRAGAQRRPEARGGRRRLAAHRGVLRQHLAGARPQLGASWARQWALW